MMATSEERENELADQRFEALAARFYKETGLLAPGKDRPSTSVLRVDDVLWRFWEHWNQALTIREEVEQAYHLLTMVSISQIAKPPQHLEASLLEEIHTWLDKVSDEAEAEAREAVKLLIEEEYKAADADATLRPRPRALASVMEASEVLARLEAYVDAGGEIWKTGQFDDIRKEVRDSNGK